MLSTGMVLVIVVTAIEIRWTLVRISASSALTLRDPYLLIA